MSLISYNRLVRLVEDGAIRNIKPEAIQGTSIDLHIGNVIEFEDHGVRKQKIVLSKKDKLHTYKHSLLHDGPTIITPGTCFLASTIELFYLPDNIAAKYVLNSSMGRIFLEHMKAGWCDPTWHDSALTLELKNCTQYHDIEIAYGDRIGQIVFFECDPVPEHKAYKVKGRYNGDKEVSGVKRTGTGGSDGC